MAGARAAAYSTITEHQQDDDADYYEEAASSGGCFRRFCFGSDGNSAWPETKFKEAKEFSETVLGPKWKNFVRRMGKALNPARKPNNQTSAQQFQYSPQSYALNFADDEEEEGKLLHSFSTRFAGRSSIVNSHDDHPPARPAS